MVDSDSEATSDPSERATTSAEKLAERVSLSHFPVGTKLAAWRTWTDLASVSARGASAADPKRHAEFKSLEDDHVFFFAGPCAYTRAGAIGDTALWLHPDVERTAKGSVSPFDTGALERGYLRPWHSRTPDERWAFHISTSRALDTWRSAFAVWLDRVYLDPMGYLETTRGRRDSGDPDKGADPDEVFAHNGPRDPSGADRRAWTWEVRLRDRVALTEVQALLLPRHLAADARAWRKSRTGGRAVRFFFLDRETAVTADDLFRESGRVCRALVES